MSNFGSTDWSWTCEEGRSGFINNASAIFLLSLLFLKWLPIILKYSSVTSACSVSLLYFKIYDLVSLPQWSLTLPVTRLADCPILSSGRFSAEHFTWYIISCWCFIFCFKTTTQLLSSKSCLYSNIFWQNFVDIPFHGITDMYSFLSLIWRN